MICAILDVWIVMWEVGNPNEQLYSVRQKKYPLKFFAIFSATTQNFCMKFHTFITHS